MPDLNDNKIKELFKEIKKSFPVTMDINKESEKKALEECDDYLKNGGKNINEMTPLSVYFIISKLSKEKQIEFIKKNIKYIKKHDEDIFLYTMYAPKSLSYYFSFDTLKELKNIDIDIFKKVINENPDYLFHDLTDCDYYSFYNEFYNELIKIDNKTFISYLYYHNRFYYDNINLENINETIKLQKDSNKKFMIFILEKYKDKISSFNEKELLNFIKKIDDIDTYKEFIKNNLEKLNIAFNNINENELNEYLGETSEPKQKILIHYFFESIMIKNDIKKIIKKISPSIIINLYNKNKENFKSLTLNDWIKIFYEYKDNDFKQILDDFEINNIESLFDTKFYMSLYYKREILPLKYIEKKYRDNIKINGILEDIDETTSVFSEKYFKNLSELRLMLKNNIISRNNNGYKKHLLNFIKFLKDKNIIDNIEGNNFIEIEKLFYRIVMGKSISILYEISNIEEITILNRIGKIEFEVKEFSVEQLQNYNIKQYKKLLTYVDKKEIYIRKNKEMILKLFLMIGYHNAETLLEIDSTVPTLEHLVGNVYVKNIAMDNFGNPILNIKLMNLLFSKQIVIKEMLSNKDNDLYKYFPRIFNEWEMIKINNKDKSLSIIIDYLKSDKILIPPKYYRLSGQFKFIGCRGNIVNETFKLHDQMLTRINSTIPRIKGIKREYTYEIARLDDVSIISVGNKTDCCFTVLGNGYSCLKHSLTSPNGRILVIKKDDEVLAHSWIWRNGDLLCFDNIEISKKISCVDFFDVYIKIIDELIMTSFEYEGIDCIKNVTIGYTNFDKEIEGIKKYPCLIAKTCDLDDKDFKSRLGSNRKIVEILPQPIEQVSYSDSKCVQYLIRGNGIFNLGQSNFYYEDDRKEIMHYSLDKIYEEDYINLINNKINALRYIKMEQENKLDLYKLIDVKDLREVYLNDDWYFITYKDGSKELYNCLTNKRAELEIQSLNLKNKILKKI